MTSHADRTPRTKPLVLLVDDQPENLRVVGAVLGEEELDIAITASGQQAIEFAVAELPDLILLDVSMPDVDGFEVCRRLKRMPACATIPVIFLTARTETDDIVQGFEAGGVDYVTKPFRPAELKARVRTHLQLHQLRGLLHICMYCNRVHNEADRWERIDSYISRQTGTLFSHSICPECLKKNFGE